ncbi:hypothetical protein [Lysinibacillus fusiformis]|uniref:hypothetical protein n=1 Tax=Lysinibacillus fusiformis TaxID=28031 RepID=UPI0023A963C0|nr:hypothetical protein [Lysinibacillus fusiformis]WEA41739.1 hypothetical protein PWJ66_22980 [Lysinibacillus fusiformis]
MLDHIDATEPLLIGIYYIQLILIFVCGVGFLFGIFMFIYAFKNPHKRRLAYVLTVLMPIGLLCVIHGPVLVMYYVFEQPATPDAELGLMLFVPTLEVAGLKIYEGIVRVTQPLIVAVLIIGVAVLHHASRIPGRKRIGYGIFLGVPFLWCLMKVGPSIVKVLTS